MAKGVKRSGNCAGPAAKRPNVTQVLPLTRELSIFLDHIKPHFQAEVFPQFVHYYRRGTLLDNIERILTSFDDLTVDIGRFRTKPLSVGHLLVYTHHIFTKQMATEMQCQFMGLENHCNNGFCQWYVQQYSYVDWVTTFVKVLFTGQSLFLDLNGNSYNYFGDFPWMLWNCNQVEAPENQTGKVGTLTDKEGTQVNTAGTHFNMDGTQINMAENQVNNAGTQANIAGTHANTVEDLNMEMFDFNFDLNFDFDFDFNYDF